MSGARGDIGFTRTKSRHVLTWTLANLARIHEHPSARDLEEPLTGGTAIVVGSGPSLARNIAAIGQAQELGALVIATNSADRPLRAAGIAPDVLVVRESLDLSDEIEASQARLICADIGAHSLTWRAAGDRLAWFLPMYPRHLHICQRLSVRPIVAGTAALTSAVSLALEWGISRLVLAGVDLALAPDGAVYHPEAPRGDCRATVCGDLIAFSGNVADDERAVRSGQPPQPKRAVLERVLAHDWSSMLPTTDVLLDQREWLATQAERHGSAVRLENGTEGGAGVEGWRCITLAELVAQMRSARRRTGVVPPEVSDSYTSRRAPRPRRVVHHTVTAQLLEELDSEASLLESISRRMLEPRGPDLAGFLDLVGIHYQAPLIETLAAWRMVTHKGTGAARCEADRQALLDAALEAKGIIERARRA